MKLISDIEFRVEDQEEHIEDILEYKGVIRTLEEVKDLELEEGVEWITTISSKDMYKVVEGIDLDMNEFYWDDYLRSDKTESDRDKVTVKLYQCKWVSGSDEFLKYTNPSKEELDYLDEFLNIDKDSLIHEDIISLDLYYRFPEEHGYREIFYYNKETDKAYYPINTFYPISCKYR